MKITLYRIALSLLLFNCSKTFAQNKILFDATKAEMAGSADWVIDADTYNIVFSSSTHLPYVNNSTSTGESNPQINPTPSQSGITISSTEGFWDGAISAWAVDCVKQGYDVETLPYDGVITYGNTSNPQDLSYYKLFVVVEPNILFSAAEKTAIMNFISNGGGLYMISDHAGADRNNDGFDSPMIWNDFMTNNPVQNNPFGIQFDMVGSPTGISETSSNVAILPTNPILHGTAGTVTKLKFSGGDTMTLNTTQNPNIKGIIFQNSYSNSGLTNVMCAYTTYGNGKVVAIGDSSPFDDNTGDPNDSLFNGYYDTTMSGNHQKLIMNSTIWLMTTNSAATNENLFDSSHFIISPNPTKNKQIHLSFTLEDTQNAIISIYDNLGRTIKEVQWSELSSGINYQTIDASDLITGTYYCKISTNNKNKISRLIIQ